MPWYRISRTLKYALSVNTSDCQSFTVLIIILSIISRWTVADVSKCLVDSIRGHTRWNNNNHLRSIVPKEPWKSYLSFNCYISAVLLMFGILNLRQWSNVSNCIGWNWLWQMSFVCDILCLLETYAYLYEQKNKWGYFAALSNFF